MISQSQRPVKAALDLSIEPGLSRAPGPRFERRYVRRMLLLPLLDLGVTGIFIAVTGRIELVTAALTNLFLFGAAAAALAYWAYRPVAAFERHASNPAAAATRIAQLPKRSSWTGALLVLVFNATASALGVYTPADADLNAFTQQEIAAALAFYSSMFAVMYGYFAYFAVNDLCIEMRSQWRDVLDFDNHSAQVHLSGKVRRGGLAMRLAAIFLVIGVLPVLLVGMDLTVMAPVRALQGLKTLDVIALDLTASLYIILASVYFVSRSLLAPTRELFDAHEEVQRGNLQYRAAVLTSDELGEVAARFNTMVGALRERELMKSALQRYLGPGVASELIASGGMIATRSVEATVMFTDIDGFTALAESLEPQETVELLNIYFSLVNRVIAREGGIINNFMGDAVVAVFNVPSTTPRHAHAAVRAAVALQREVTQQRFRLPNGQSVALPTRIGIHTGTVSAGAIGASERQGYTVYGDAVNLAARIEPLNKRYGTRILVSQATRDLALAQGCRDEFRPLESVTVRGRIAPVMLFELATDPADSQWASSHAPLQP